MSVEPRELLQLLKEVKETREDVRHPRRSA